MTLVVIESPLGSRRDGTRAPESEVRRNKRYLTLCMRESLDRGEAPFASHRLYPGVLDDGDPAQRQLGMEAGFAWGGLCQLVAVYVDYGITPGMQAGINCARTRGARVVFRVLPCPGVDFEVAP